jgi:hypothetical protein
LTFKCQRVLAGQSHCGRGLLGKAGEAGELLADASGTSERAGEVWPDLGGEVGVRGAGQHGHPGAEEATLGGLVGELLGGDRTGPAEALFVRADRVGEVEQAVPGRQDHHASVWPGQRPGSAPRGPVVPAGVHLPGAGGYRLLAGATGHDDQRERVGGTGFDGAFGLRLVLVLLVVLVLVDDRHGGGRQVVKAGQCGAGGSYVVRGGPRTCGVVHRRRRAGGLRAAVGGLVAQGGHVLAAPRLQVVAAPVPAQPSPFGRHVVVLLFRVAQPRRVPAYGGSGVRVGGVEDERQQLGDVGHAVGRAVDGQVPVPIRKAFPVAGPRGGVQCGGHFGGEVDPDRAVPAAAGDTQHVLHTLVRIVPVAAGRLVRPRLHRGHLPLRGARPPGDDHGLGVLDVAGGQLAAGARARHRPVRRRRIGLPVQPPPIGPYVAHQPPPGRARFARHVAGLQLGRRRGRGVLLVLVLLDRLRPRGRQRRITGGGPLVVVLLRVPHPGPVPVGHVPAGPLAPVAGPGSAG